MRHLQKTTKINRHLGARKALIRNLLLQLYQHGSITTTQAKAKLIKPLADQIIAKAQKKTNHHLRQISSQLNSPQTLKILTNQIIKRYTNRKSGFTTLVKIGHRQGDDTMMVKLSLLPADTQPETKSESKPSKTKKTSTKEASVSVKNKSSKSTKTKTTKSAATKSTKSKSTKSPKTTKSKTSNTSKTTPKSKQTKTKKNK